MLIRGQMITALYENVTGYVLGNQMPIANAKIADEIANPLKMSNAFRTTFKYVSGPEVIVL